MSSSAEGAGRAGPSASRSAMRRSRSFARVRVAPSGSTSGVLTTRSSAATGAGSNSDDVEERVPLLPELGDRDALAALRGRQLVGLGRARPRRRRWHRGPSGWRSERRTSFSLCPATSSSRSWRCASSSTASAAARRSFTALTRAFALGRCSRAGSQLLLGLEQHADSAAAVSACSSHHARSTGAGGAWPIGLDLLAGGLVGELRFVEGDEEGVLKLSAALQVARAGCSAAMARPQWRCRTAAWVRRRAAGRCPGRRAGPQLP